jgi:F420-0:gamma-glutamyl ligase-like protein
MSEPKYRPGILEPVLYLLFWMFQTWGWILLLFFLGWKILG